MLYSVNEGSFIVGVSLNAQKEDKKELIYNAALKVISKKGYHDATMQDIASQANLAVGTIYNYFENKQDMAFSLFKEKWDEYRELAAKAAQGINDPREAFKIQYYKKIEYLVNQGSQVLILFSQMLNMVFLKEACYSKPREIYQMIISDIVSDLTAARENGFLSFSGDGFITANMIFGAIQHFIIKYLLEGRKMEKEDIDASYDFILNGLNAEHF